jgi:protein involved in polysaccharide export with SLBB domain
LKVLLEKDYYYHATVIIGLDSVNQVRGQIYISGMVLNQGAMNILFNQNLTAGEAILQAGGFSEFADKKSVKIFRNGGNGAAGGKTFEINKGKVEQDVTLEPGDFIIVPARMVNF